MPEQPLNEDELETSSGPRMDVRQPRGPVSSAFRQLKKRISRLLIALSKRSVTLRRLIRSSLMMWRNARFRRRFSEPIDEKMIIFESFQARSYSCSPKALYKAIIADPRFDDFTLVWAFRTPMDYADVPELGRATVVAFASAAYQDYYATAKYWVTNAIAMVHLTPREGQVYIQTWHGTPLKRLGCDIRSDSSANVLFSADEIHRRYTREGERLTYLLSPSDFATEKLGSAFGLDTSGRMDAIIQEGYPRNDVLSTFGAADVESVKARLDIPRDKRVILYAPTFRDNQHSSATGYTLDLGVDFRALREQLGPGYVVLFRAHYLVASEFDFAAHEGFVFDVSDLDDINELYIASDILITDYSSVFFDYANLKRPIIYYMYDLEHYADELRGIYLDVADLPGPITRTQDELVAAILAADAPSPELQERYRRFNDCYNYLDDGHASERVIERIFGPSL